MPGTVRKRIREAVGKTAGRVLGPAWWPSCGLCSWRARFMVKSWEGVTPWSAGWACADHLAQMVAYHTDNGLPCRVEPAQGRGRDAQQ